MTARHWCFTDFEVDTFRERAERCQKKIQFITWSLERCPKTERLHIQGFITVKSPVRLTGIKKLLSNPGIHAEMVRGSLEQNMAYTSKTETHVDGPWQIGSPVVQGTRTDLIEWGEQVKDLSKRWNDIILDNPPMIIKYPRGSERLRQAAVEQRWSKEHRFIEVKVLYGKPGVGKTSYVYEKHGFQNVYTVRKTEHALWFDGYDCQDVLLIEDYDGGIMFKQLLNLLDIYPLQLAVKGGFTWAAYHYVYITSNHEWNKWYKDRDDINALYRRIHVFIEMSRGDEGNTKCLITRNKSAKIEGSKSIYKEIENADDEETIYAPTEISQKKSPATDQELCSKSNQ